MPHETSLLDRVYSSLANRKKFFYEGWGRLSALDYLLSQPPARIHLRPIRPVDIRWRSAEWLGRRGRRVVVRRGDFASPYRFEYRVAGRRAVSTLPPESQTGRVEMVLPRDFQGGPLVLHFAATGDESLGRRRRVFALPLAEQGIGSVILENPLYGGRRLVGRDDRFGTFTDFLMMSRAVVDEGIAILRHLRANGYGPLGTTGVSMGGYMSLNAAARVGFPVAVAACIPSHSASPVYTQGVMREFCDWKTLGNELLAAHDPEQVRDPQEFLMRVLDIGDLRNLPVPPRPDAAVIVAARRDAYIPSECGPIIAGHWKGARLHWIDTGHVGAFLRHQATFRNAIVESFERLAQKGRG